MTTRKLLIAVLAATLTACATTAPPPDERDPADPWEPFNRNMYQFNRTLDRAIFKPVATGYEAIVPDPVETGVTHFFENLQSLPVIANLTLQGRPGDSIKMFARFTMNTLLGVGGLFDVATRAGLPQYDEDFGQTLAVWGWSDSRYLVLPLLGPSTVRDGVSIPANAYIDIPWREAVDGREFGFVLELIQRRANLLPRESQLEDAYDEYLFVRDAWLQNRRFKITGEAATPDYDAFLEEDYGDDGEG